MAANISNSGIEEIYDAAKKAGATGGKISGAGGGGFMIFYCPGNCRYKVIETLENFGGQTRHYQFTKWFKHLDDLIEDRYNLKVNSANK